MAAAENVPLVGINARMSKGSYRRWLWAGPLTRALLGSFVLVLAQSDHMEMKRYGSGGQYGYDAYGAKYYGD